MADANALRRTMFAAIETERPYLMRFALAKLRDEDKAEEAVQETMLAALTGIDRFAGASSLRTWLTGILKFKMIDYQRRVVVERERFAAVPAAGAEDAGTDWLDQLFDETGHWRAEFGTWALPDVAHEQAEFFAVFERCMDKLPTTAARVFFQREVMGADTDEICKDEEITASNCWVILHRARIGLRECLDHNWFGR